MASSFKGYSVYSFVFRNLVGITGITLKECLLYSIPFLGISLKIGGTLLSLVK